MKKTLFCLVLLSLMAIPTFSQQVSIGGNKFYVNGQEIFFNGVNTAWQKQSDYSLDFLGRNYDATWWNTEFQRYSDNKINLARVWIHGSGNYSPSLNGSGVVTGVSAQFWTDMDKLVALSRSKKVYLMPTFWSFDMVKDQGSSFYNQYRQIINDENKTRWYIEYFLRPFLLRYENEPYVMGYDICNEPEHMWRDANCGNLSRDNVVRFVAMCAAEINQRSSKPVTLGSMWILFNSSKYTGWDAYAGNNYSDASLQARISDATIRPYARLDFWSPHWYQWQSSGSPFSKTIGDWMDNGNKPTLIGETPGYDVNSSTPGNVSPPWNITLANYYKQSYWNGYAGVCAWKNPWENDGYGYFNSIATATRDFHANYPNLVYPGGAPPTGNLLQNAGFEANVATQTPSNWSEWNNAANSYTEAKPRSGSYNLAHWGSAAYEVSTYQIRTGLTNGAHTLKAWVKSSGGQAGTFMYIKNHGGTEVQAYIPTTATWTQLTLTANVSNGQAEVGFYSKGNANNWIIVDDVEFSRIGTARLGDNTEERSTYVPAVFPNPNNGNVKVSLPADYVKNTRIIVRDHNGKTMATRLVESNETSLNLANAASGLYLIEVISPKGRWVKKLILNND